MSDSFKLKVLEWNSQVVGMSSYDTRLTHEENLEMIPSCLLLSKLNELFSYEDIWNILQILDETCPNCWDEEKPGTCYRDD